MMSTQGRRDAVRVEDERPGSKGHGKGGEIECLDDNGLWANWRLLIVGGGVYMVLSRQCICWGHLGSRGDLPLYVEVL